MKSKKRREKEGPSKIGICVGSPGWQEKKYYDSRPLISFPRPTILTDLITSRPSQKWVPRMCFLLEDPREYGRLKRSGIEIEYLYSLFCCFLCGLSLSPRWAGSGFRRAFA